MSELQRRFRLAPLAAAVTLALSLSPVAALAYGTTGHSSSGTDSTWQDRDGGHNHDNDGGSGEEKPCEPVVIPPPTANDLRQESVAGLVLAAIPEGAASPTQRVRLSDLAPTHAGQKLEVELKLLPLPFDGLKTKTTVVPAGGNAFVTYDLLVPPAGATHRYHWRARFVDAADAADATRVSAWAEFGVAGNEDFTRSTPPAPPAFPEFALRQDQVSPAGVVTPIPPNGELDEKRLKISADVDGPASPVVLEVELKPVTQAFTGTPTKASPPVTDGVAAVYYDLPAPVTGETPWHWRARVVDATDPTNASAWVEYGVGADPSFVKPSGAPEAPTTLQAGRVVDVGGVPTFVPYAPGASIDPGTVVFHVNGPAGNPIIVQFEVKLLVNPFNGADLTSVGPLITDGATPIAAAIDLPAPEFADEPDAYHWRARVVDAADPTKASAWVETGDPTVADFLVTGAAQE